MCPARQMTEIGGDQREVGAVCRRPGKGQKVRTREPVATEIGDATEAGVGHLLAQDCAPVETMPPEKMTSGRIGRIFVSNAVSSRANAVRWSRPSNVPPGAGKSAVKTSARPRLYDSLSSIANARRNPSEIA